MSIEETRNLGIEFERRVQTMIPEKEFFNKLDTETIYSYLNQYQDKYVHEIYRNMDNIPSGSKISAHVESVLQSMIKTVSVEITDLGVENYTEEITDPNNLIVDTARSVIYPIDEDFYMYIRSVSKVSETFSFRNNGSASLPIRILPNILMSQSEVWKMIETPHDSLRILRNPVAVLSEKSGGKPTITVIYDRYTKPEGIKLTYYKQPTHFDIMTNTPCELPMDAFDDLVTGAVDLYVQYVAGAEANKRRQDEQARKQAERQNKERNKED